MMNHWAVRGGYSSPTDPWEWRRKEETKQVKMKRKGNEVWADGSWQSAKCTQLSRRAKNCIQMSRRRRRCGAQNGLTWNEPTPANYSSTTCVWNTLVCTKPQLQCKQRLTHSESKHRFPQSELFLYKWNNRAEPGFVWSPSSSLGFGLTGTSLEMGDWPWAVYSSLNGLESATAVFTLPLFLEGHI